MAISIFSRCDDSTPEKTVEQGENSDKVSGLVRETYKKEPGKFLMWSWKGYTATSTLAHVGMADIDVNEGAAVGSGQRKRMEQTDRAIL